VAPRTRNRESHPPLVYTAPLDALDASFFHLRSSAWDFNTTSQSCSELITNYFIADHPRLVSHSQLVVSTVFSERVTTLNVLVLVS
jgi:hypothetical protein